MERREFWSLERHTKVGFELYPKERWDSDEVEEKGLGRTESEACKPYQEHTFLSVERKQEE